MPFNKHHNFISVAQKALNHFIDENFVDADGNPVSVSPESLVEPVSAFRNALTVDDTDSIHFVIGKMLLALIGSGYLARLISDEFYGIPKSDYKQTRTGLKNQILFLFKEPKSLQKKRQAKHPKTMQIGVNVQWMELNLGELQAKIKETFPPISKTEDMHFCGLNKYPYYAPQDGLQITQLPAINAAKAREMIEKVCSIFDIEFKPDRLKVSGAAIPTEEDSPNVAYVYLHRVEYIQGKDKDLLLYRPLLNKELIQ